MNSISKTLFHAMDEGRKPISIQFPPDFYYGLTQKFLHAYKGLSTWTWIKTLLEKTLPFIKWETIWYGFQQNRL